MGEIDSRLRQMGLTLPVHIQPPAGTRLPFEFARVCGSRVLISGHAPLNPDGSLAQPLGKLGRELTIEAGYRLARLTTLGMLGSLSAAIGDLDRVRCWVRIFGMVTSAPGFTSQPAVINGCSDLILELFGPVKGAHARSAVGVAELPFGIGVEIEAEVEI